jgi:hypothetical protein
MGKVIRRAPWADNEGHSKDMDSPFGLKGQPAEGESIVGKTPPSAPKGLEKGRDLGEYQDCQITDNSPALLGHRPAYRRVLCFLGPTLRGWWTQRTYPPSR